MYCTVLYCREVACVAMTGLLVTLQTSSIMYCAAATLIRYWKKVFDNIIIFGVESRFFAAKAAL